MLADDSCLCPLGRLHSDFVAKRQGHAFGILSYLTAVIALVSQLALGAVLLPDMPSQQQFASLEAANVFCDGNQTTHGGKPDHKHRQPAPAICPISITLSLPSIVLAPTPVLPAPSGYVIHARAFEHAPGRGPPPATARVGVPRAPPLSI